MATSTIPAVRAALLSALQERAGLSGVQVTIGIPRNIEREWVKIGNVTGIQRSAAIGAQRRDEFYTVVITVSVVAAGIDDPTEISERAFALTAEVEQALRPLSGPPLGVTGLTWALIEKTDLVDRFDGNEREAEVTIHVACRARI